MITITQTGPANRFLSVIFIVILLFFLTIDAGAQTNQTVVNGGATTAAVFPGTGCGYYWTNDNPGIGLPASGYGTSIASFTAINTGNSATIATIKATPVHAGLMYVANSADGTVSVITTQNDKGAPVPDGLFPVSLALSPDGGSLYVVNENENRVCLINTVTHTITATIPVGASPMCIAINQDGSMLYVTNSDANTVSVINTATNLVITTLAVGINPLGVVVSHDGSRVYVATSSGITVIDAKTNTVTTTYPTTSTARYLAISPDDGTLYVSTLVLTVINTKNGSVVASVPVGLSPFQPAVTPDGSRIYESDADSGTVTVIDAATNLVLTTINVGLYPHGVSINAEGSLVYVANYGSNTVSVISTVSNQVVDTFPVGTNPTALVNFGEGGSGCSPVSFTITVNPDSATPPVITTGVVTGVISACAGTPSAGLDIQQFTVSGSNLTTDITATAPPGFEVSLVPGSGYGNSVTLAQSAGSVNDVSVYVRSAATAVAGSISGDVILNSNGVSQNVAVTGNINALPVANAVANQTVLNGASTTAIVFTGSANAFTWTNDNPTIGLAASGSGNISSFTAINTGNSPVKATITATPVSPGFAYIVNQQDNTISVINTLTNAVTATLPAGEAPIGASVSPDGSRLYVTNQVSNTVSVFNTLDNARIADIPVGAMPYGIWVSPDNTRVYVANHNSNNVSVIDVATNKVSATIAVGKSPYLVSVSPDSRTTYVTNSLDGTVSEINTITNIVTSTISVGIYPYGLVVSPDGSKLYVVNGGSNTVSVISTVNNALLATIGVGLGASGIAISRDGNVLYVANTTSESVSVISTVTNTAITSIPDSDSPMGVALSQDGNWLYVTNSNSKNVSLINTATNTVSATIPVGTYPISFGNFITAGTGCSGVPITFTITVDPGSGTPPVITTGIVTGTISACSGTSSTSPNIQQFTVSGNNLTADITVAAPAGFEISLTQSGGYSTSITLSQSGGFVNNGTVYVRSAATAATGSISGNVTLTSLGAPTQAVAVAGIVNALPIVNTIANQTLTSGQSSTTVNFTGTANTYNWVNDTPGIGLSANGTGDIASFTVVNTGSAPVIATITVTPINSGYAYIANQASNDVSVVNTSTSTVVATIPVGSGPLSSIVSPDGSLVYAINSGSNNISVINTSTNTVTSTIPAGNTPFSGAVTPDGTRLYVANWGSDDVSVINTATHNIEAIVPVGLEPSLVAASPDGTKVYVTNFKSASVSVIDVASHTVVATVPVGNSPYGVAVSPDNSTVYVVNSGDLTISVIDAATNTVKSTIKCGAVNCIAISPDGKLLYVSNTNAVAVIDAQTGVSVANIQVPTEPFGISLTPDGSRAYVADAFSNTLSVINTLTNTLLPAIPVGDKPNSLGNFVGPSGCTGNSTSFTITVNPSANPIITTSGAVAAVTTTYGTPSESSTFTVSGANLTGDILVTAPLGFEVGIDNITFSSNAVVGANGTASPTTVYVRIPGTTAVGSYTGTVTLSSPGAPNVTVTVTATVTPAPLTITADNVNKIYGTTLMGSGAGATAFISTGLKNSETISSITITYSAGTAATDGAGAYTGSVNASAATGGSFTAGNYNIIYLPGDIIVAPAPLTIIADNKIKIYLAENPPLTAGYIGFVNNDGSAQLTTAPVLTTTAVGTSPVGQYPITVGGAAAQNYNITYLPGMLTVELMPATIAIPNTFTPNGDGINDSWTIKNIEFYANCSVEVYNRYGENVYSSIGYGIPWNGTYKGARLPTGTYYYIIDLKNKSKVLSGFVAIIR